MTYRLTAQADALRTLIVDRWGVASTEGRMASDLAHALPGALTRLMLATPDGWAASTSGTPGSRSSSSPDRLGGIVARRQQPTEDYAGLARLVVAAAMAVWASDRRGVRDALGRALGIIADWQPPLHPDELESIKSATRCAGGNNDMAGYLEWSRPDCDNVAASGRNDGLCDACRMRRWRWQQRQVAEHA